MWHLSLLWARLRNLAAAAVYTLMVVSVLVYLPKGVLQSGRAQEEWIDPMKGRLVMPLPVDFDEDHTPETGPPPDMAKYMRTRPYKLAKHVLSNEDHPVIIRRSPNASMELPADFLKTLEDAIGKLNLTSEDEHFYVTFINSAYLNLSLNWLCNTLVQPGIHERTLFITTGSSENVDVCVRIAKDYPKVQCIDSSGALSNQTDLPLGRSQAALKWGQRAYVQLLALRALVLRAVAKLGRPFVLFETDAVWPRSPIGFFDAYADDADVVVPVKGYPDKGLTLSFDPLVVRPSNASVAFLERMCRGLITDVDAFDQDLLDALCKQQYAGVNCATFEWEEVADGLWYKLSQVERDNMHPFVINNNFIIGVDAKVTRQALNGHWFLTVDHECNVKRAGAFVADAERAAGKKKRTLLQVKMS